MRLRCFVAVDVEDLNIVRKLTDVQRELASVGTRLKLVEPENLHLTLAFIGEVPPPIVEAARRALGEVSLRRFKIRLVGIGAFPTINRPRVVWVGVSEGREELQVLAREVRASLKRHGVPFDKKEFVPHLTIARVKGRGEGLARILSCLLYTSPSPRDRG